MKLKQPRPCRRAICAAMVLATAAALAASAATAASSCAALGQLALKDVEITTAETIGAGAFRPAVTGFGAAALAERLAALPAFCRIAAVLRPSADSEIGIEVWLPEAGWNGKLEAVGNGAWAGSLSYSALADALGHGYAAASTDTGHTGNTAAFAVGHPAKLVDFAQRAVHEMTVAAKAIVAARYGAPAEHAYFVGCSTGGRQALTEAQRYPADYDGIVAGAAAYHPTHLQGAQIWTAIVGHDSPGAALTTAQLELVNDAVVAACDARDGVSDGVIENPAQCDFDPGELACTSGQTAACLAPAQATTVRKIYAGPTAADGSSLFPGVARGSELGWRDRVTGEPIALAVETYRDLVYADPSWDYREFDPGRDIARGVATIGALMDATDPDLEPFLARGGKLILYHGWNDPGIPPLASVDYYERVVATVGQPLAGRGVRLFMVPGMNHCGGGVGTDRFDTVEALDRWVATEAAPARIEAARVENGRVVRTRPLCPYPQVAVYAGSGDSDAAASFTCR